MKAIYKILIQNILFFTSFCLMLFGFSLIHTVFNNYYNSYRFFDMILEVCVVVDSAILVIIIGFFIYVINTIYYFMSLRG